jgi:plasmid stability protein
MAITITLEDDLFAELKDRAKKQQLSVEQLVIRILTEAMTGSEPVTPQEAVARVQVTPVNPAQLRAATADLGDLLHAAPSDPCFDLESWKRQWSDVEAEMKAITRANDIAEGRGRSD